MKHFNQQTIRDKIWLSIPIIGIGLFVLLYLYATTLYPGGSQADLSTKGFSWLHNYWCNLLNEQAMNGTFNFARPVAILGMIVLCTGLSFFWYYFPRHFDAGAIVGKTIQVAGIGSMVTAMLLFTKYHDIVINVSSLLGLAALLGTFAGLYKNQAFDLFWLGFFCVFLMGINNFIYYSGHLLYALPLVQKVTFVFVLGWVVMINLYMLRRGRWRSMEPL